MLKLKTLFTTLFLALSVTAAQADDWNGIYLGGGYTSGSLSTDVPQRDFDNGTAHLSFRLMTQGNSRIVTGFEGSWDFHDGHIAKTGRRLKHENAEYGFTLGGFVGIDTSIGNLSILPHFAAGVAYINTTWEDGSHAHGSDGYYLGVGAFFRLKNSGRSTLLVRYQCSEFDGPAQGSDLGNCGPRIEYMIRF